MNSVVYNSVPTTLAWMVTLTEGFSKGKGPLVTCINAQRGSKCIAPLILTSVLDGGEWSTSVLGRFTPGKATVHTIQEAGWAPRPILKVVENRKYLGPTAVQTPNHPVCTESL